MTTVLVWTALVLAAVPAMLFLLNLLVYRRLPQAERGQQASAVSVLVPARNEESSIQECVASVCRQEGVEFEVVVVDDHSTDRTAALVEERSRADPRVRLVRAPQLPPGWCGKQHACAQLAVHARHDILLFLDADVRLEPSALVRIRDAIVSRPANLLSGFPRQETGTWLEKLVLPLMHFLLLGFLPMAFMRRSTHPAFGAGCGQLFVTERSAYERAGGHSAIRASRHDGITLPRAYRRASLLTDLCDSTDLARCRMYRSAKEVWNGLAKNATEGLASPLGIVPWSIILVGGQVLPVVLASMAALGGWAGTFSGPVYAALAASYTPRIIASMKFRQPFLSVVLHPVGVLVLVMIQWYAFVRERRGQPASWKGRPCGNTAGNAARELRRGSVVTRGDRLWRVAFSGNSVALVALLATVSAWPTLFAPRSSSPSSALYLVDPNSPPPNRVLLVVFDALADEVARDAEVMPNLARLARQGAWGDGRLESIVPSTVAGIQVLATGEVPPPLSILEDFGARRSRDGGVFSLLHEEGKRTFVAGPYLWFDLYGEWIHAGHELKTVRHDDARVLQAALSVLDEDRYSLIVVHLSLCDDLAHLYRADSREYRDGARACDRALAELVERAGPFTAVVATTDHGVTDTGGHASADAAVVRVPVVTSGPGLRRGELGTFVQGAIHDGLRALLSLPRRFSTDVEAVAAPSRLSLWFFPVALGALCTLTTLAAAARGWRSRSRATSMDVAFWCGVSLTFLQLPVAAVVTLLIGSASGAPPSRALRRYLAPVSLMSGGAVFSLLRGMAARWLDDGGTAKFYACAGAGGVALLLFLVVGLPRGRTVRGAHQWRAVALLASAAGAGFLLGGVELATISLLAAIAGVWLARYPNLERGLFAGVVVASLPVLLCGATGESLSLSELDLRFAFERMDGAFGIVGAASIVALRHAFPAIPFLVGMLPVWRRGSRRELSRVLAGAAAFFAGEALLFGGTLALADSVWSASLAFAGVLRVLFELCVVFLGVAVMIAVSRRPQPRAM